MKSLLRALMLFLIRLVGAPGQMIVRMQDARIQGDCKGRRQAARGAGGGRPHAGFTPTTTCPPKILLIRPDHLGDLVLTTPILHALKEHAPNAEITMMVGPWSSEMVARHPAIDHIVTCPFPGFERGARNAPLAPYTLLFRTAQQLQRTGYDLAINLRPDFWWGAALLYLAHIPHRIGCAIQPGTPFLTHALPFHTPEHATVANLRLVNAGLQQALGYPELDKPYTPEHYPLHFAPTAEEHQWVAERLQRAGIDTETPIIVIHPGTGAAVKLWRPEAWTATANMLTQGLTFSTPVRIILTGSMDERSMLAEIAQGFVQSPFVITDTTVSQLAALLKRADLVLGVDNGPLHLAVAQGTPTLHIFGPTDARIFGPWGSTEQHVVIASSQRCVTCPTIPCGRLDFRSEELAAHPCTRLVSQQRVEAAINQLVAKHNSIV